MTRDSGRDTPFDFVCVGSRFSHREQTTIFLKVECGVSVVSILSRLFQNLNPVAADRLHTFVYDWFETPEPRREKGGNY